MLTVNGLSLLASLFTLIFQHSIMLLICPALFSFLLFHLGNDVCFEIVKHFIYSIGLILTFVEEPRQINVAKLLEAMVTVLDGCDLIWLFENECKLFILEILRVQRHSLPFELTVHLILIIFNRLVDKFLLMIKCVWLIVAGEREILISDVLDFGILVL